MSSILVSIVALISNFICVYGLKSPIHYALMEGNPGSMTPRIVSNSVGECDPIQVHLSSTGDAKSVRVTWATKGANCANTIRYGRRVIGDGIMEEGKSVSWELRCRLFPCIARGSSWSFDGTQACGPPADSGVHKKYHIHTAVLDRLQSGKIDYWYQMDSDSTGRKYDFRSPGTVKSDANVTVLLFGDMGAPSARKCPGSQGTIDSLMHLYQKADIIIHMGDISYADGDSSLWDEFMDKIEPFASTIPYMICIGNHEYDWIPSNIDTVDASGLHKPFMPWWGNFGDDSYGECGYPTFNRFPMPQHVALPGVQIDSNPPFWYAFASGPAQFIIMSTEHDMTPESPQRMWLEQVFHAVDRSSTPWLFVVMHRPMYVAFPHKSNRKVGKHLKRILEDAFLDNNVDAVFSGHIHAYFRTCKVEHKHCVEEGDPSQKGMHHFIIGSAGKQITFVHEKKKQPLWLDESLMMHGIGRLHVQGSTSATFEFIETESGKNTIVDSIKITKSI